MALGFIDDIVYGMAGPSTKENAENLKCQLQRAEEWRQKHGAQFEESKYVLVHFTHNHYKSTEATITINGVMIEPSNEAKYLRIVFDKKLCFNLQLQQAIKKGTKTALALGSIGKSTWGAPHECIKQLFQATVAARMDYSVVIWHRPKADSSTALSIQARKFTTVQRLAMKATLGCFHTTPTAAMEIESGIPPAWIRLQSKALSATVRMVSLAHGHPVQKWITKAKTAAKRARKMADKVRIARCKITHMTNLENMAVQFPFVLEDLEEIKPFDQAPWDPGPWQQQQQQRQYKEGRTKYTQKAEIKRLAETTWQAQWEAESQTRKTVASHLRRIVKDDFKQGQELYKAIKHRNSCAILTQLRTGHCGLNGYLSKVKKIESAKCDYCGYEKETVEHFLLECPQFQEQRIILRRGWESTRNSGDEIQGIHN